LGGFRVTLSNRIGFTTGVFNMSMRWFERDKEKDRFYLLPGMGGTASRRKRQRIFRWSVVAGLFTSAIVAGILYLLSMR
jgi:hypothetical protein